MIAVKNYSEQQKSCARECHRLTETYKQSGGTTNLRFIIIRLAYIP